MHPSLLFVTLSTVLSFVVLLILVRWIGSTQLTQLTYFNWVAGASMGNIAANMMSAANMNQWLLSGCSLVVFSAATVIASYIALKNRAFRRVSLGEPVVLIHRGSLVRENLRKTKVNLDVLMMMLREKGYFAYNEIDYGILEPTGNLSILPSPSAQSVSKQDLRDGPDLSRKGQGPYTEIVVDGEIDDGNLRKTGHDRAWLMQVIREHGAHDLADVMFLAVNEEDEVMIDVHRETLKE